KNSLGADAGGLEQSAFDCRSAPPRGCQRAWPNRSLSSAATNRPSRTAARSVDSTSRTSLCSAAAEAVDAISAAAARAKAPMASDGWLRGAFIGHGSRLRSRWPQLGLRLAQRRLHLARVCEGCSSFPLFLLARAH